MAKFDKNKQTMFTIDQIKDAHAKVKSGADFPRYIQDLKKIAVQSYVNHVSDGQIVYSGMKGVELAGQPKWPARTIAPHGKAEQLKQALLQHQQGQTSYPVFCELAAAIGVDTWRVDIDDMQCTYFDKSGQVMLTEIIPLAKD